MAFPSDQTNFEHTFGAKVTFYKPIDAEEIVAKTVTINGKSDSTSLIVRESSNLSTLSVSNQSIFKNISVTGIATVNNIAITGELYDGDGNFGSAGQVLSSDGDSLEWINTSSANVGSASNVGTNENGDDAEQYVTFVQNKTGNNPIRVDEGIKYNPSTNTLTVGIITASTLNVTNSGVIPTGGIIMWSGAASNIPNGWVLCDGQNSTPDLRNRFVIGASDSTGDVTYPGLSPHATGGSANAVVVEHTHSLTDPGHNHQYQRAENVASGSAETSSQQTTFTVDYALKTTVNATTGISVNSQGVSGTNANLPPYYALCYIMKT
tara:strand:- start:458 stop:1423 length:966 start_codon:yes stop_codon:yes gene_type:complete